MDELVLTEKNTLFKTEAKDWVEGVRIAGEMLVKQGCAKPKYVDNIIKAIRKYGPYVVIAEGIAIPHTRPEEGALETGCALVTLKEPVYFEGDTSPVKVLISFSAIDNDKHIDLLRTIIEFIEQGMIDEIAKVGDYEEFLQLRKSNMKMSQI